MGAGNIHRRVISFLRDAAAYLLRSTFSRQPVITGSLTVVDTSTGSISLTDQKLEITTDGSSSGDSTGVYSTNSISRQAGTFVTWRQTASTVTSDTAVVGFNSSANIAQASDVIEIGINASGKIDVFFHDENWIIDAVTLLPDVEYQFGILFGGYLSTRGDPSTSGTYGAKAFWKNANGDWELLAGNTLLNTSPMYFKVRGPTAVVQTFEINKIAIPTVPQSSIFAPAGHFLDTFTDVEGTNMADHVAETGQSWTFDSSDSNATSNFKIKSNRAGPLSPEESTPATTAWFTNDTGLSDFFLVVEHDQTTSGDNRSCRIGYRWNQPDSVNITGWVVQPDYNGNTLRLYEVNPGPSFTSRTFHSQNLNGNQKITYSIRANGDKHEVWTDAVYNGVQSRQIFAKVATYTSSVHQNNTGVHLLNSLVYRSWGWIHALPITSQTYNDALNVDGQPLSNFDLYHDFVGAPDTSFSNGQFIDPSLDMSFDLIDDDVMSEGVGDLTVRDASSGTVHIVNNQLHFDPTATITDTQTYSDLISMSAGKQIFSSLAYEFSGSGVVSIAEVMVGDTGVNATDVTNGHTLRHTTNSTIGKYPQLVSYSGGSVTANIFPFARDSYYLPSTLEDYVLVIGGYDSLGAPSSSGTYGASIFLKDRNTLQWELMATDPTGSHAASDYVSVRAYSGFSTTHSTMCGEIKVPTAPDTSVFTPVGYALDTFDTTFGTLNSGQTWTQHAGTWSVVGGRARATGGLPTDAYATFDSGLSDLFMSGIQSTASTNTDQPALVARATDVNNLWIYTVDDVNNFVRIYERTSGSYLLRSSTSMSITSNTDYHTAVRLSGTLHECWIDGDNRVSYTSSVRQTATRVGLRSSEANSATPSTFDNLCVLPLTSSTYDQAFDLTDLKIEDYDLYHDFNVIDDHTFTNGNKIYSGLDFQQDGSLVVHDTSTGTVSINSNTLQVTTDNSTAAESTGVYSQAVTRGAGMAVKWTHWVDTVAIPTAVVGFNSAKNISAASRVIEVGVTGTARPYATFGSETVTWEGSANAISPGTDYDFAIVLGGWDAGGVPNPDGLYGARVFVKLSGTWNLLGYSSQLNTSTLYWKVRGPSGSTTTTKIDTIKLPDPTGFIRNILHPAGSSFARFDTDQPADATFTSESGDEIRTNAGGVISGGVAIQNNVEDFFSVGGGMFTTVPSAHVFTGDFLANISGSARHTVRYVFRYVASQSYYYVDIDPLDDAILWDRNGGPGTAIQRAVIAVTLNDNQNYTLTVRDDGNFIEYWLAGGKASYDATGEYPGGTPRQFQMDNVGIPPRLQQVDNFCLMPIQSTTYDTLLNKL